MSKRAILLVAAFWVVAVLWSRPQAAPPQQSAGASTPASAVPAAAPAASPARAGAVDANSYRAVLDRYCVSCHNDRLKTAGLTLQSANIAEPATDPDTWEK